MNKPYVIGIIGGSGSGKTFFLESLINHFSEDELCLISQDNYYRPFEEQPRDENGEVNFDLPQCIDDSKLLNDLKLLLNGSSIQRKEYTFNVDKEKAKTLIIRSAPIVVIEGLFIFHYPAIAELLDLRIFVHAEDDIMLERRLARDIKHRGYTREMIIYQWENHVKPAFDKYLLPYKPSADIVMINNTTITDGLFTASDDLAFELKKRLAK